MALERRQYRFAGNVQGVGFRYATRRLAANHAVVGYVRNLADGQVELVAEGEPSALDAFLAGVERAFEERIRDVDRTAEPVDALTYEEFSIRH
jgi:acylphosphatase